MLVWNTKWRIVWQFVINFRLTAYDPTASILGTYIRPKGFCLHKNIGYGLSVPGPQ